MTKWKALIENKAEVKFIPFPQSKEWDFIFTGGVECGIM